MMDHIILLPGIMGTELKTPAGDLIWPPSAMEIASEYGRIDELLRDDLTIGEVIRNVLCVGVYQPLIDTLVDIGYTAAGPKKLVILGYDWRKDLAILADALAAKLDAIVTSGAQKIGIVAHSMGGLVARLALEDPKNAGKAWLSKVVLLATLGTPHLGAPLALARILGLSSAMGVKAKDFKRMAADHRYPSGYQLLPPPSEGCCWDVRTADLNPMGIYDAAVAAALGLDPHLLDRAKWVHGILSAGRQPAGVRYFFFAGAGHRTVTRVNVGATAMKPTEADDAGDGTVPLWSALPRPGQRHTAIGEHAKFFRAEAFKAVLYPLLGKAFPIGPFGLAATLTLSVQNLILRQDEPIDLLLIPSAEVRSLNGRLRLERAEAADGPFTALHDDETISYAGPALPQLRVKLPACGRTGLYRLRFQGEPAASGPVEFAVMGG